MSDFPENLRQAMHDKHCKSADVAKATGINPSVLSRYLSGRNKPNSDNIIAISHYLNVSPEWLLSSSDAPKSIKKSQVISSVTEPLLKIIEVQDKLIKNLEKTLEKTTDSDDTIKNLIHLADQIVLMGHSMAGIVTDKKSDLYLSVLGGLEKLGAKVDSMKTRFFIEEEIEKERSEMRNLSIVHELQNYPKRGRPPKGSEKAKHPNTPHKEMVEYLKKNKPKK